MADTLRVNIEMTDDPTVVVCKMRFGNKWVRAKLRRPEGWSGKDGSAALVDPEKLGAALDAAKARGEMEKKNGPGMLWVKVKPEAGKEVSA